MTNQLISTIDPFEKVNKVNNFLKSLGYKTGSKTGYPGMPLDSPDGISVLFEKPDKNWFDKLFIKPLYIHCIISWNDSTSSMLMSVPGRGENNSHLIEMGKLAEAISDHFGGIPIIVKLTQEEYEYDEKTQLHMQS